MNLPDGTANTRTVLPYHDKQILGNETQTFILLHDLYMREPLAV